MQVNTHRHGSPRLHTTAGAERKRAWLTKSVLDRIERPLRQVEILNNVAAQKFQR